MINSHYLLNTNQQTLITSHCNYLAAALPTCEFLVLVRDVL